jgi:hypothetical protein
MMLEAAPAATFEMVEPELIFEFLIITLDAPAQFGEANEISEGRRCRQGREPILRGLRALLIAMGGPHTQPREAGAHRAARPFAPRDRLPRRRRQGGRQLLETLRGVRPGTPHAGGRPAAALPALRRLRRVARRPCRHLP